MNPFHWLPDVNDPESMADAFNNDNTEYPSEHFPLHLTTIRHYQDQDTVMHRLVKNNSLQYPVFRYKRVTLFRKTQSLSRLTRLRSRVTGRRAEAI